jgi:hypothetical protein
LASDFRSRDRYADAGRRKPALARGANLGGASYGFEKVRVWLAFFNGDGRAPFYHGAGVQLGLIERF